jgi:hypothetical protein
MKIIIAAIALLASIGTSAEAQIREAATDPANRADLQCLAVMAAGLGAQQGGSEVQMGLVGGIGYYLGRLEGRAPDVAWLDQMERYLTGDFEAEFKAQSQRCGEEMIAFGAGLTAWSERMQTLAAKRADPKN